MNPMLKFLILLFVVIVMMLSQRELEQVREPIQEAVQLWIGNQ